MILVAAPANDSCFTCSLQTQVCRVTEKELKRDLMMQASSSAYSLICIYIYAGDSVALMVNNLGGTSVLELNIVANEAVNYLGKLKGVLFCSMCKNI